MTLPKELVKGSLKLIILFSLSESREYGYSLAQSIREKSNDSLKAGEGSLYPALYKLEQEKLISSEWDDNFMPKRKYYTITKKGLKFLKLESENWRNLINVINLYLK